MLFLKNVHIVTYNSFRYIKVLDFFSYDSNKIKIVISASQKGRKFTNYWPLTSSRMVGRMEVSDM